MVHITEYTTLKVLEHDCDSDPMDRKNFGIT